MRKDLAALGSIAGEQKDTPSCGGIAGRLIRIAKDKRLRQHAALLPADSTTLGKLCSLTDERFHELLEDGTIHVSMGRNDMAVHAVPAPL